MCEHDSVHSATTEGLTIAPSLDLIVEQSQVPRQVSVIDGRLLQICGFAIVLGVCAALVAQALLALIALTTNFAFFGRFSVTPVAPGDAADSLGLLIIVIPVLGAVIVGVMAR